MLVEKGAKVTKMQVETISRPGATLSVKVWPTSSPRGVLQIVHGMVEHASRYDDFAQFLNSQGFAVVAHDHRGHGDTVTDADVPGFFADVDGWQVALDDVAAVRTWVDEKYAGVPHFMLGHSMGSLMLRDFLGRSGNGFGGDGLAGAIVMGTAIWPGAKAAAGVKVAALLKKVAPKAPGKLLNSLTFAGFNDGTEKRTEFDWLSRDNAQVDKYIADPKCGYVPTNTFFGDLLAGTESANADSTYASTSKELPIWVTSGAEDPVGGAGAVTEVYAKYLAAGVQDVEFKVYPGGRHEILNEVNRTEVYEDLAEWLMRH